MKIAFLLPALLTVVLFTSCTKDQIEPIQESSEKTEARQVINTVSNSFVMGTWCIASCISNSNDIASKYKAYCFAFATNGSLILKDETAASVVGKWVVSYVDGKARVSFTFLSNSGFDAVGGSWTLLDGSTNKKMSMQSVTNKENSLVLEQL